MAEIMKRSSVAEQKKGDVSTTDFDVEETPTTDSQVDVFEGLRKGWEDGLKHISMSTENLLKATGDGFKEAGDNIQKATRDSLKGINDNLQAAIDEMQEELHMKEKKPVADAPAAETALAESSAESSTGRVYMMSAISALLMVLLSGLAARFYPQKIASIAHALKPVTIACDLTGVRVWDESSRSVHGAAWYHRAIATCCTTEVSTPIRRPFGCNGWMPQDVMHVVMMHVVMQVFRVAEPD
eukprot:CAMPEP_0115845362 /NCGR_PEP_ID=MMETSP0287-20121206/9314_1 /TAXON_ID=412157 /ORGANISM="Chrysochromulina rotalis, Strain UIO044" /LENGTH=240 /DNA_ID=CAMNT_0003299135 /DNA_START=28 /DNA_END=751 /DNA_ORIENTATION=+